MSAFSRLNMRRSGQGARAERTSAARQGPHRHTSARSGTQKNSRGGQALPSRTNQEKAVSSSHALSGTVRHDWRCERRAQIACLGIHRRLNTPSPRYCEKINGSGIVELPVSPSLHRILLGVTNNVPSHLKADGNLLAVMGGGYEVFPSIMPVDVRVCEICPVVMVDGVPDVVKECQVSLLVMR